MSECNRPLEAPFGVFRKFAWSSCGVPGAFLHLSWLRRWKIKFDVANPSTFESPARSFGAHRGACKIKFVIPLLSDFVCS